MDPRGQKVTQITYFSLFTQAKKLPLVSFCDTTAEIGKNGSVMQVRTDRRTEGQTDVKGEIVI